MSDLTILSMGWGVQTWTLAAMMALGEHHRADYIVFADTNHEHQATYDFIQEWSPWLSEHGLSLVEVKGRRTEAVVESWSNSVMMPAFTIDSATGKRGQVRRQCTGDWKIVPIRAFIREELERRGVKRRPGVVECWQGISLDEYQRMRTSDAQYITNRYPLVERRITRAGCVTWLEAHGLPAPRKSSCTFCPYKGKKAWGDMKREGGEDWQEAVFVDELIRERRPKHQLFIHPGRRPLTEAVEIPEDHGASQYELEFEEEQPCDGGYCHV